MTLDRYDAAILDALQKDGRKPIVELADEVGLSNTPCARRVKLLEQAGIIQGYHARLDPFAIEIGLILFAEVTLKEHGPEAWQRFESAIAAIPQIVEGSHVSGAFDYLLKAVVTDMDGWTAIRERLTDPAVGADRINTHVLMSKPKTFVGYPIDGL